jgi:voltage-gated potassium channel
VRLVLPGRHGRTLASGWLVPLLLGTVLVVVISAAAAAAFETRTVTSFWRGIWWAVSLITTVGFIGEPPETRAGEVLSAGLMVLGFLLLAIVSASLAALFVREDERPWEERERSSDEALAASLSALDRRLTAIEQQLAQLGAGPPERAGDAAPGQGPRPRP